MKPEIDRDYAPRWYVPRLSLRAIVEAVIVATLAALLMAEVLP